jgi:hypothetical protein
VLIRDTRDVALLSEEWSRHGVSFVTGVNTLYKALLASPEFAALDLSQGWSPWAAEPRFNARCLIVGTKGQDATSSRAMAFRNLADPDLHAVFRAALPGQYRAGCPEPGSPFAMNSDRSANRRNWRTLRQRAASHAGLLETTRSDGASSG